MKKCSALFFITALLLHSFILAEDIEFTGKLTAEAGAGLPYTNSNSGKYLLGRTVFDSELKNYSDTSSLFVNGSLTYDALHSQSENNTIEYVSGGGDINARIKEAWYDYSGGWWSLRIGRQITSWGKADDIQVTDILCPKDNSTLIASNYADSRLGIDAVRLSYTGDSLVIDAYMIPFFTPGALPLADGNPLKKIEFPAESDGYKINSFTNKNITLPEQELQNSEYAMRMSAYLPFADLSLYGFYGWDDLPVQKYTLENDDSITITADYHRLGMAGIDAAIPISQILLRLEAAFFPQRYFSTKAEQQLAGKDVYIQRNQVIALAGIDWNPSGFTITAQYYADTVLGDIDLLDRRVYEHQATLSIERSFLNDIFTLSLIGAMGLTDFDSYLELEAAYALTDQIKLSAIGDFYNEGKEKGEYGKYKDLSCITLKGVYRF